MTYFNKNNLLNYKRIRVSIHITRRFYQIDTASIKIQVVKKKDKVNIIVYSGQYKLIKVMGAVY